MLKTVVLIIIILTSLSALAGERKVLLGTEKEKVNIFPTELSVLSEKTKAKSKITLPDSLSLDSLKTTGGIFGGGTNWNIKEEQITDLVQHGKRPVVIDPKKFAGVYSEAKRKLDRFTYGFPNITFSTFDEKTWVVSDKKCPARKQGESMVVCQTANFVYINRSWLKKIKSNPDVKTILTNVFIHEAIRDFIQFELTPVRPIQAYGNNYSPEKPVKRQIIEEVIEKISALIILELELRDLQYQAQNVLSRTEDDGWLTHNNIGPETRRYFNEIGRPFQTHKRAALLCPLIRDGAPADEIYEIFSKLDKNLIPRDSFFDKNYQIGEFGYSNYSKGLETAVALVSAYHNVIQATLTGTALGRTSTGWNIFKFNHPSVHGLSQTNIAKATAFLTMAMDGYQYIDLKEIAKDREDQKFLRYRNLLKLKKLDYSNPYNRIPWTVNYKFDPTKPGTKLPMKARYIMAYFACYALHRKPNQKFLAELAFDKSPNRDTFVTHERFHRKRAKSIEETL